MNELNRIITQSFFNLIEQENKTRVRDITRKKKTKNKTRAKQNYTSKTSKNKTKYRLLQKQGQQGTAINIPQAKSRYIVSEK